MCCVILCTSEILQGYVLPWKQPVERTLGGKLEGLDSIPGPDTRQLWVPRPVTTSELDKLGGSKFAVST